MEKKKKKEFVITELVLEYISSHSYATNVATETHFFVC